MSAPFAISLPLDLSAKNTRSNVRMYSLSKQMSESVPEQFSACMYMYVIHVYLTTIPILKAFGTVELTVVPRATESNGRG